MREEGWKRIYGKKGKWRNRRELGCIWMVRVLSLCGRGWLAKSIFRDLLRQPQDGAKTYVLRYFDQNLYFPAHIFENPGEAMLGGESFMVRETQTAISPGPTAKIIEISQWKTMFPARWWCAAH